MPGSSLTGYVARKQLTNLIDGEADFVALRLDKHNPDDVCVRVNGYSIPNDVVSVLMECYGNVTDMDLRCRINELLEKHR